MEASVTLRLDKILLIHKWDQNWGNSGQTWSEAPELPPQGLGSPTPLSAEAQTLG